MLVRDRALEFASDQSTTRQVPVGQRLLRDYTLVDQPPHKGVGHAGIDLELLGHEDLGALATLLGQKRLAKAELVGLGQEVAHPGVLRTDVDPVKGNAVQPVDSHVEQCRVATLLTHELREHPVLGRSLERRTHGVTPPAPGVDGPPVELVPATALGRIRDQVSWGDARVLHQDDAVAAVDDGVALVGSAARKANDNQQGQDGQSELEGGRPSTVVRGFHGFSFRVGGELPHQTVGLGVSPTAPIGGAACQSTYIKLNWHATPSNKKEKIGLKHYVFHTSLDRQVRSKLWAPHR